VRTRAVVTRRLTSSLPVWRCPQNTADQLRRGSFVVLRPFVCRILSFAGPTLTKKRCGVSSPVDDAVNHDPLWLHFVDEPIGSDKNLAPARIQRVRKGPSALAELGKRVAGIADPLRKCGGEGWGVSSDVLDRLHQVVRRWLSPDYPASHFERRPFTSS